jgi:hypothetical protein
MDQIVRCTARLVVPNTDCSRTTLFLTVHAALSSVAKRSMQVPAAQLVERKLPRL